MSSPTFLGDCYAKIRLFIEISKISVENKKGKQKETQFLLHTNQIQLDKAHGLSAVVVRRQLEMYQDVKHKIFLFFIECFNRNWLKLIRIESRSFFAKTHYIYIV